MRKDIIQSTDDWKIFAFRAGSCKISSPGDEAHTLINTYIDLKKNGASREDLQKTLDRVDHILKNSDVSDALRLKRDVLL